MLSVAHGGSPSYCKQQGLFSLDPLHSTVSSDSLETAFLRWLFLLTNP